MKKNADNTPTFVKGERVKVAGQQGEVTGTLEDGRVSVKFGGGQSQPIEPDKVERE